MKLLSIFLFTGILFAQDPNVPKLPNQIHSGDASAGEVKQFRPMTPLERSYVLKINKEANEAQTAAQNAQKEYQQKALENNEALFTLCGSIGIPDDLVKTQCHAEPDWKDEKGVQVGKVSWIAPPPPPAPKIPADKPIEKPKEKKIEAK